MGHRPSLLDSETFHPPARTPPPPTIPIKQSHPTCLLLTTWQLPTSVLSLRSSSGVFHTHGTTQCVELALLSDGRKEKGGWSSRLPSCLTLCDPISVAHQAPLSMGFSRREHWSGLPCPPPGDLPDPGIEPTSLLSPALAVVSLPLAPPWIQSLVLKQEERDRRMAPTLSPAGSARTRSLPGRWWMRGASCR